MDPEDAGLKLSGSCQLSFSEGAMQLRLPIPAEGIDESALFYAAPSDSAASLLESIKTDRPLFADAHFLFPAGSDRDSLPLSSMTVSQLTSGPFDVAYSGMLFNVEADAYLGGAYGIDDNEGRLQLRSLLQKGAFARVRKQLDAIKKPYIHYSEFTKICLDSGVPLVEAPQLCKQLHRVGIVLHFPEEPSLRDLVFLDPEDVVDSVFSQFGLLGPRAMLVQQMRSKLEAEAESLEQQITDKRNTQLMIEQSAQWWATQFNRVLGVSIGAGTVFYMYLAYIELSWDIMEPVTYFTATALSLFGYWWWLATSAEFEYSNIHDVVLNWRRRVKYRQVQMDTDFHDLDGDGDVDEDDAAHPLAPRTPAPDAQFQAALDALELRLRQLREELDTLK